MDRPINFTKFVEIFSIIGAIISFIFRIYASNYHLLSLLSKLCRLKNHKWLSFVIPSWLVILSHPTPLIFFLSCLNPDILFASLVKYLLTFFFCFCLLILVSNYIFDIPRYPMIFWYIMNSHFLTLPLSLLKFSNVPYSTHTPNFSSSP